MTSQKELDKIIPIFQEDCIKEFGEKCWYRETFDRGNHWEVRGILNKASIVNKYHKTEALMIDLFNLACMQEFGQTFPCEVKQYSNKWVAKGYPGDTFHMLVLFDSKKITFSDNTNFQIPLNQCPLYARYFEFLERGV